MGLSAALVELGVLNIVGMFGVMIGLPLGALDGAVAMHIGLVKSIKSNKIHTCLHLFSRFVVIVWIFSTFSLIAFLGANFFRLW